MIIEVGDKVRITNKEELTSSADLSGEITGVVAELVGNHSCIIEIDDGVKRRFLSSRGEGYNYISIKNIEKIDQVINNLEL